MSIILPDGTEARSLQEQVIWLTKHNIEPEKYLKEAEVDGNTLTLTNKDGTEVEFTPQTGSAYTAGDGINITNNEIAVKHGSYLGFDSSNQLTLNNYAKTRIEAVDSKSAVSAATSYSPGAATAKSITIDGTAYNLPEGGSGGSTDFNDLTNRPMYNGTAMTGSTNIPEVQNYTFNPAAGININTSGNVKSFSVDFAVDDGLKTDGNDQLTVDYTQVQHKLTAGSNITISGNTISATGSSYVLSQGPGININTSGNTKIFTVDFAADDGLKTDGNDQLTVDYNQVQQKLVAGSNITISGNTISATGGGTSAHLYRHDIRLKDNDTHGHEIYFTLYSSQATSMTYAQLLAALPDNGFEMPAGGFDISDDLIYTSICAYDGCICATAYSAGEVVEDDYEAAYTTITDLIKVIL